MKFIICTILIYFGLINCAPTPTNQLYENIVKECPNLEKIADFKNNIVFKLCENYKGINESAEITDDKLKDIYCLLHYTSLLAYCSSTTNELNIDIPKSILEKYDSNSVCNNNNSLINNLQHKSPILDRIIKDRESCLKVCLNIYGIVHPTCNVAYYYGNLAINNKNSVSTVKAAIEPKATSTQNNSPQVQNKVIQSETPVDIKTEKNSQSTINNNISNKTVVVSTDKVDVNSKNLVTPTKSVEIPSNSQPHNEEQTPILNNLENVQSLDKSTIQNLDKTKVNTETVKSDDMPRPDVYEVTKGDKPKPEVTPVLSENNEEIHDVNENSKQQEPQQQSPQSQLPIDNNTDLKNTNAPDDIAIDEEQEAIGADQQIHEEDTDDLEDVVPPDNDDVAKVLSKSERKEESPSDYSSVYSPEMEGDSYFFSYFMLLCIIFIVGYVFYHNKQKVLALLLEGRRGKRQYRSRRPNSANYHKLDSNLEEAITSSCSKNVSNVIY